MVEVEDLVNDGNCCCCCCLYDSCVVLQFDLHGW